MPAPAGPETPSRGRAGDHPARAGQPRGDGRVRDRRRRTASRPPRRSRPGGDGVTHRRRTDALPRRRRRPGKAVPGRHCGRHRRRRAQACRRPDHRAISQATVIAVDLGEDKLALAREVGAHRTVTSDASAADRIRELTDGLGASAVFDFVGVQPTLDLAREVAATDSFIHIVGIGGGLLPTGFFSTPMGAAVRAPYWGTRGELIEVLELARSGAVGVHVERYDLDSAVAAYRKLHDGTVRGGGRRAVAGGEGVRSGTLA